MIRDEITVLINGALKDLELGVPDARWIVEHPDDMSHGDYSTNVAMVLAKKSGTNSHELADKIVETINHQLQTTNFHDIEKVEVAGPGFINFHLSQKFFEQSLKEVIEKGDDYGKNEKWMGKKIMVEYTDPNPFKVFHIGHLVPNAIGESISRIFEFSGAKVLRALFYGDIGMHVAKSVWGMEKLAKEMPNDSDKLSAKTAYLGKCYTLGAKMSGENEGVKQEINKLNKELYEKSNESANKLYEIGRAWSLAHFETIYNKLGSKFVEEFPESMTGGPGVGIIKSRPDIFIESNGALIFKGEEYGLHTRVFLNGDGLPTYEAKDLGLAKLKFERHPDLDLSVTVTGTEQKDYFMVVKKAMSLVMPDIELKTKLVANGMMRLTSGKMSSRTGEVVSGEAIIEEAEKVSLEIMKDRDDLSKEEREIVATMVAVGAIKFSVLKTSVGKDFVFDFSKAFSFDGDSGPYLQYTFARCHALKVKGQKLKVPAKGWSASGGKAKYEITTIDRLLYRFPEVVELAGREYAPHYVCTYLLELAGAFNSYYGNTKIIDEDDIEGSALRLVKSEAVGIVMKNGLRLLGIKAPDRM